MNDNSIHFVKSSVLTKEETLRGIDAYYSELDYRFENKDLIVYSDDVIQSEINTLKELGYSQDAIDHIMKSQKDNNEVILPHKLRNFYEFNSRDDAEKYFGREHFNWLNPKRLKNGHVLVFHLPEETTALIEKYIDYTDWTNSIA